MTMTLSTFLVEDSPLIREALIPAMAELGSIRVMATAESQEEAIGWLADHKGQWDLAVVDFSSRKARGSPSWNGATAANPTSGSWC